MYFDSLTKSLFTNCGKFLKRVWCPANKTWNDLAKNGSENQSRFCRDCRRKVHNVSAASDDDVAALLVTEPDACLFIPKVRLLRRPRDLEDRRIIQTARTEKEMNEAASRGLWPLLKLVTYDTTKIRRKIGVSQNPKTGEVSFHSDYRASEADNLVIPFTWYYPNYQAVPIAAYLLPKGLKPGEKVTLEDPIEDYSGRIWNQGDIYRAENVPAIWNGKDFDIQMDEIDAGPIIG